MLNTFFCWLNLVVRLVAFPRDKFCKGMRSESSIYPAFEVVLQKTLKQPWRQNRTSGRTAILIVACWICNRRDVAMQRLYDCKIYPRAIRQDCFLYTVLFAGIRHHYE